MKLEVQDGEYGYGTGRILFSGVCFSVAEGEIMTILGPNGVGKTTLLKCITSLLRWKKGETYIDGKTLAGLGPNGVWKKIGYVPQSNGLVFSYTVLDMVLMGRAAYLSLFAMPTKNDLQIAREALKTVGISYLEDKRCSEISGGEMQLVLIARALASEPQVLILDEPESHLDFKNQLLVLGILEKVAREEGISCIINTHYPDHALRISDKTLMLGKSRGHIFGKVGEVISEENLRKFFGVDVRILSFDSGGTAIKTVVPLAV